MSNTPTLSPPAGFCNGQVSSSNVTMYAGQTCCCNSSLNLNGNTVTCGPTASNLNMACIEYSSSGSGGTTSSATKSSSSSSFSSSSITSGMPSSSATMTTSSGSSKNSANSPKLGAAASLTLVLMVLAITLTH